MIASWVRSSLLVSKSLSAVVDFLSFFRFFSFAFILWVIFFSWSFAIFLMSSLNVSQSSCGLFWFWFVLSILQFSMSVWRVVPLTASFFIRCSSSSIARGHDHLPFPIWGVSFGVYFTRTIQWSVLIVAGLCFQPNRSCWRCFAAYMRSSRDIVVRSLVFALYVY